MALSSRLEKVWDVVVSVWVLGVGLCVWLHILRLLLLQFSGYVSCQEPVWLKLVQIGSVGRRYGLRCLYLIEVFLNDYSFFCILFNIIGYGVS